MIMNRLFRIFGVCIGVVFHFPMFFAYITPVWGSYGCNAMGYMADACHHIAYLPVSWIAYFIALLLGGAKPFVIIMFILGAIYYGGIGCLAGWPIDVAFGKIRTMLNKDS
jgi:hypothetical protein